ncbi:M14 family zinc carboxypeptidase [Streptosporangium sp. 'caverna']|uniref:M14 family zinc carboxypeptidase n=1 Tax=Streptosporangium sp. 'caverna' TaxID=2202249 RepID=UPI0019550AD9|nr:M14 family zinc carboxypeptidase [Streptosporangium sp. 'caverna']
MSDELDSVPDYHRFATVDEVVAALTRLAADHPGVASLRRVGSSSLGEPILCLTVGDGPRHALIGAMPHPNEPIGGLTVVHLATRMCQDATLRESTGYTWHIVGCLDPDGTRLNEGWFAGPFTKAHYGRHFYRPAGDEQVEWTFPFSYKNAYFDRVIPETLALMRLIDETRPAFMSNLHNSEMGGAYFYLSRPVPELQSVLKALPGRYGVPLHGGEAEHPSLRRLDEAVFLTPRLEDAYDYLEALGQDPMEQVGGGASDSYAARYGTLCLAAELPYWRDPAADDHSPAGIVYSDLLRAHGAELRETFAVLDDTMTAVASDLRADSPFIRASRFSVPLLEETASTALYRAKEPTADRPATVAEQQSCHQLVHSTRLRFGGMLLRALEGEMAIGNGTPAIRAHARALSETYATWCAEAEAGTPDETIPIRHLVAIQYGGILAGAAHAAGTYGSAR